MSVLYRMSENQSIVQSSCFLATVDRNIFTLNIFRVKIFMALNFHLYISFTHENLLTSQSLMITKMETYMYRRACCIRGYHAYLAATAMPW